MEYLATFHTHYGAVRFHKHCQKSGDPARMLPVPRELSASCGTCVRFEAERPPAADEHEDMDRCYAVTGDGVYSPADSF